VHCIASAIYSCDFRYFLSFPASQEPESSSFGVRASSRKMALREFKAPVNYETQQCRHYLWWNIEL
jgi:hypothetical protein